VSTLEERKRKDGNGPIYRMAVGRLADVLSDGIVHGLVDAGVMRAGHHVPETGEDVSSEDERYKRRQHIHHQHAAYIQSNP